MPDTIVVTAPAPPADGQIRGLRQPAPADYIARRVIAAKAGTVRGQAIEACRAELEWAHVDVLSISAGLRLPIDADSPDAFPLHEASRLPHEHAAARVLNAWGHLHPVEWRLGVCWKRLRDQRRARQMNHAALTADDVRWYRAERRKLKPILAAAIAAYARLRTGLDAGGASASPLARAAFG